MNLLSHEKMVFLKTEFYSFPQVSIFMVKSAVLPTLKPGKISTC